MTKPKTTTTPGKRPASPAAAPDRKPLGGRRSAYRHGKHGGSASEDLARDLLMKPGSKVDVVRPVRKATDGLIFRILPALEDVADVRQAKLLPYREDPDGGNPLAPGMFSDWFRQVPAALYAGFGEDRYSFFLYDKSWQDQGYDPRSQNPYLILQRACYRALSERQAPGLRWLDLKEGPRYLPKPKAPGLLQALIFQKGKDLYVGSGRLPKGLGPEDRTQVVQISEDTAIRLEEMLNALREDYDGNPTDFEQACLHGDPVHPKFGRFIRLQNSEFSGGAADANVEQLDRWDMGGDQYGKGGRDGRSRSDYEHYNVFIDDVFTTNGHRTKISPQISVEHWKIAKTRIRYWDDILHIPETEELCEMIARAYRGGRQVLDFGWREHPEFFTPAVNKLLANAVQVFFDNDRAADPGERRRSANVPTDGTGLEYEDASPTGEVGAESDSDATAVDDYDAGYGDEAGNGEEADFDAGAEADAGEAAPFDGELPDDAAVADAEEYGDAEGGESEGGAVDTDEDVYGDGLPEATDASAGVEEVLSADDYEEDTGGQEGPAAAESAATPGDAYDSFVEEVATDAPGGTSEEKDFEAAMTEAKARSTKRGESKPAATAATPAKPGAAAAGKAAPAGKAAAGGKPAAAKPAAGGKAGAKQPAAKPAAGSKPGAKK